MQQREAIFSTPVTSGKRIKIKMVLSLPAQLFATPEGVFAGGEKKPHSFGTNKEMLSFSIGTLVFKSSLKFLRIPKSLTFRLLVTL